MYAPQQYNVLRKHAGAPRFALPVVLWPVLNVVILACFPTFIIKDGIPIRAPCCLLVILLSSANFWTALLRYVVMHFWQRWIYFSTAVCWCHDYSIRNGYELCRVLTYLTAVFCYPLFLFLLSLCIYIFILLYYVISCVYNSITSSDVCS
jgi:hypothetical protein